MNYDNLETLCSLDVCMYIYIHDLSSGFQAQSFKNQCSFLSDSCVFIMLMR